MCESGWVRVGMVVGVGRSDGMCVCVCGDALVLASGIRSSRLIRQAGRQAF